MSVEIARLFLRVKSTGWRRSTRLPFLKVHLARETSYRRILARGRAAREQDVEFFVREPKNRRRSEPDTFGTSCTQESSVNRSTRIRHRPRQFPRIRKLHLRRFVVDSVRVSRYTRDGRAVVGLAPREERYVIESCGEQNRVLKAQLHGRPMTTNVGVSSLSVSASALGRGFSHTSRLVSVIISCSRLPVRGLTAAKLLVPSHGDIESTSNPLDLFIHPREGQPIPYGDNHTVCVWRMTLQKRQLLHLFVSRYHTAMSDGVAEGDQI